VGTVADDEKGEAMISVLIERDESGQSINIKTQVPPLIALAVVTTAYHELLSKKIQADFDSSVRLATRRPKNGG
jgi:hypothetical protein